MSVSPLEFLDRTALFGGLDPQFKQVILERLEQIELPRGHVVFKEGDTADALYLVVEGQAQVFVTDRQIGIEVEVARLGTHEAFGEVSLLTGEPRKAGVRALTPMLCYVLRASVFRNVLLNAPQVALAICRTLATRLDNLNRERGSIGNSKALFFAPLCRERLNPRRRDARPPRDDDVVRRRHAGSFTSSPPPRQTTPVAGTGSGPALQPALSATTPHTPRA